MAEGEAKTHSRSLGLIKWSEYLMKLSSEAKIRYESKVVSARLNVDPSVDPYVIEGWS